MARTILERSLVGPAGEHFVLYKLHAPGMLGALAPRNAPHVDIIVMNPDETVTASVQVKSRTQGADGGWHMKAKHEELIKPRLFYCLVDFEPESPVTYVVPSKKVAAVLRESHRAWLAIPGKGGRAHQDSDMRRVLAEFKFALSRLPPSGPRAPRAGEHDDSQRGFARPRRAANLKQRGAAASAVTPPPQRSSASLETAPSEA